jgi:competence protein ComFB
MNFDSIHNYYEPLVVDYIMNTVAREPETNQDFLEDVACLALNQLPVRYVRHDVDMAFFLTTREREKMQQRISEAVLSAVHQIHNSQGQEATQDGNKGRDHRSR